MTTAFTRRAILTSAGAFAGAYSLPSFASEAKRPSARVAVIGGGFAGGTFFRELSRLLGLEITLSLISESEIYNICPLSNLTLANNENQRVSSIEQKERPSDFNNISELIEFTKIRDHKIFTSLATHVTETTLKINDTSALEFDFLVLAPGIDLNFGALDGYSESAAGTLPHAWKAGKQTELLRNQLRAMPDGGTVIITTPTAPYRCPPGPYERASLIAHYLKTHKPRSKILLLDSNPTFSKQALFEAAWERFYPGIIERRGPADDGRIIGVNAKNKSVITDFDEISGDVVNVIPPQKAGKIAELAGVTDASGWCPVDPVTFESKLRKNIFVIGDAAQLSPMPKSAFAAAQQARICALNLARRIKGLDPIAPVMSNTCYSFLTPERACSITGVYQAEDGQLLPVKGAGGQSPIGDEALEIKEAGQAKAIIDSLLTGAFG